MATVDLTWTPSVDSHDGERVYRATGPSPSFPGDYTQITDIAANSGSYTDSNAPDDTQVWYGVTAYNADGESSALTDDIQTSPAGQTFSQSIVETMEMGREP